MTSSGVTELVAALRAAHIDADGLQVAEALWLAQHASPLRSVAAGLSVDDPPVPVAPESPEPSPAVPPPRPHGRTESGADHVPVNLPASAAASAAAATGTAIRAPEASLLPSAAEIHRALRPLKRRVATGRQRLLDEDATVRAIADSGTWTLVLRPAPERWLDLALVIDDTTAMDVWSTTVADLHNTLRQLGAFRDVRAWRLDTSGATPSIEPATARTATRRHPRELVDPLHRRAFFVVTDGAGTAWRDGTGAGLLGIWAAHGPVLVLQPLPERLWARTGLAPRRGAFRSTRPGEPTRRMSFTERRRIPRVLGPGEIAVPVAEISPSWLESWARLVGQPSDDEVHLPATIAAARVVAALVAEPPASPPAAVPDLVARFRATASPQAFRLAVCFAMVPLVLPVMRLVQRAVLPSSGPAHLAEVLLSGLLVRRGNDAFDLLPGARDLLLDDLLVSEANQVLTVVGDYVATHRAQARTFAAVIPGNGDSPLQEGVFAWLPVGVLSRLTAVIATTLVATPVLATVPPPPTQPGVPEFVIRVRDSIVQVAEAYPEHDVPWNYHVSLAREDHQRFAVWSAGIQRMVADVFAERGWTTATELKVSLLVGSEVELGNVSAVPVANGTSRATLTRFEQRMNAAVANAARSFKGMVHPVEICDAMQRETAAHRALLPDGRTLVPNHFVIELSPRDHSRADPFIAVMVRELVEAQAELIGLEGWVVHGNIVVTIERDNHLDHGMFRVTAEVDAGGSDAPGESAFAPGALRRGTLEEPPPGVVGRWLGRVARTWVGVDDVLEAMWEEAWLHRTVGEDGATRVPNRYIAEVAEADLHNLRGEENEISERHRRAIDEQGWIADRVQISVHTRDLEPGTFQVSVWTL